jgi:hypothetical protein
MRTGWVAVRYSMRRLVLHEAAHENVHKDTDNFLVTVGAWFR